MLWCNWGTAQGRDRTETAIIAGNLGISEPLTVLQVKTPIMCLEASSPAHSEKRSFVRIPRVAMSTLLSYRYANLTVRGPT